jgi:hypothetical protein
MGVRKPSSLRRLVVIRQLVRDLHEELCGLAIGLEELREGLLSARTNRTHSQRPERGSAISTAIGVLHVGKSTRSSSTFRARASHFRRSPDCVAKHGCFCRWGWSVSFVLSLVSLS